MNNGLKSEGTAKQQYRTLKRRFKFLVYENECYQEQLRNLQRKLLKLSRDKNFLLDRLQNYEKVSDSSDDSDALVELAGDQSESGKKQSKAKDHTTPNTSLNSSLPAVPVVKKKRVRNNVKSNQEPFQKPTLSAGPSSNQVQPAAQQGGLCKDQNINVGSQPKSRSKKQPNTQAGNNNSSKPSNSKKPATNLLNLNTNVVSCSMQPTDNIMNQNGGIFVSAGQFPTPLIAASTADQQLIHSQQIIGQNTTNIQPLQIPSLVNSDMLTMPQNIQYTPVAPNVQSVAQIPNMTGPNVVTIIQSTNLAPQDNAGAVRVYPQTIDIQ